MLFPFAHLELLGAVDGVHGLPGPKQNMHLYFITSYSNKENITNINFFNDDPYLQNK